MNDPNQTVDEVRREEAAPALANSGPQRIGRYRIERLLGQGGFGIVYLAHDDQLQRLVAIKVPHCKLVGRPEDAAAYLTEARTVANLDHPNIVPVHDVGNTDEYPCYVVSKYIDGTDLATRLKQSRLSIHETVELVATVAEALHFAHKQGLVHRDIKPGNILLKGRAGDASPPVPFVADFGLALRERDIGKGPHYAGTPAYMSPEQARGEGHRVDGRSDIFSLGVVLYEMLTGRRPFHADSREELLEQITNQEVRPPRQWYDTIPKELERICLKTLSKRASERYTTANDMGDDLRHFLTQQDVSQPSRTDGKRLDRSPPKPAMPPTATPLASETPSTPPTSDNHPIKIVPKGLRSFDAHDADFFLELLPGPRDREGLPDTIRFWKTRIEEKDADNTFAVGLVYGPSGCGKSSLFKAGLLPRLSDDVIAVYVEATAEETETRLLNGLRKRCLSLPANLGLKETMATLRRGQGIPPGKKVLIVLDQFEQWLHAKKEEETTELVQALRQCDGGRVQCVVMVRDDFWLSVSRFLRELEIRLLEGQNSALADLFDMDHAKKVLAAFGRAFGKLPENSGDTSKNQKDFLNQAVSGLVQEGKVVCVRLALFAEMMKGKSWTPATLKEVGGTEGVGVTFLEEMFSAATAPPEHRYHQKAARGVLRALLPESGADIKGHMRSQQELLEWSGYAHRPRDFTDLLRILDSEIRLITPTDPEGEEAEPPCDKRPRLSAEAGGGQPATEAACGNEKPPLKYYQLTHDYLVPSLRQWLTRKQRETRRGRAELRLAERAALWSAKPQNGHLPAWWEWANIRLFTRRRDWTAPQRDLMKKATRYHGLRLGLMLGLMLLLGWGAYEVYGRLRAQALVHNLATAETADVPRILQELKPYRRWADPLLEDLVANSPAGSKDHLHAALALIAQDPQQEAYLREHLLNARPEDLPVLRDALKDRPETAQRLWTVLGDARGEAGQRLRAASALALYDPDNRRWTTVRADLESKLVNENIQVLPRWAELLSPIRQRLAPLLAERLITTDPGRFQAVLLLCRAYEAETGPLLHAELDKKLPTTTRPEARDPLYKRQAQAAVALVQLGKPARVWPLLAHRPDPTLRTFLIHRFAPVGTDPQILVDRLMVNPEVSQRRALLLALGEIPPVQLSGGRRGDLVQELLHAYRDDPDPGFHAALLWQLGRWKEGAKDIARIDKELLSRAPLGKRRWYVNRQGHTFAILGPDTFAMGSGGDEGPQIGDQTQHQRHIPRSFAIATREVTVAQFEAFRRDAPRFRKDFQYVAQISPEGACPINNVSWYDAAAYCNWLSAKAGIDRKQWCYVPNAQGDYAEGMKMAANFLALQGYRLPTEAEWEYACRAGAATAWACGSSEAMVGNYAWYAANSPGRMQRVGSKKPNDFGLFDMHGNAWEWCQTVYGPYPKGGKGRLIEDKEDSKEVINKDGRSWRGGDFNNLAVILRCAYRYRIGPAFHVFDAGFRPARTLTTK